MANILNPVEDLVLIADTSLGVVGEATIGSLVKAALAPGQSVTMAKDASSGVVTIGVDTSSLLGNTQLPAGTII